MEEGGVGAGGKTAAEAGAWICFEDETGQGLRPPRGRTWGRRGRTPLVRVRGAGHGWISVAGMVCYRPGRRSRLIYRLRITTGRRGERRSFTWQQYRNLIHAAHLQLDGPIVLVWDNLNVHLAQELKAYIHDHDWLTVVQLPSYAPDLNPVEGIWSILKRSLGNLAATDLDHLTHTIKHRLKTIQYRPTVLDGCLTGAGLALEPATANTS